MITYMKDVLIAETTFEKFKYVFTYDFDRDKFECQVSHAYSIVEDVVRGMNSPEFLYPFFAKNKEFASPYFKHVYYDDSKDTEMFDINNGSTRNTYKAVFIFKPEQELSIEEVKTFCEMFYAALVLAAKKKDMDSDGFSLSQVIKHKQVVENKEIQMFQV